MVLYSPDIFEKAGITRDTDKPLATVAVGFTKTIFILVTVFFLDRIGRRPLLIFSVGGMILSLVGLGSGPKIIDHSEHKLVWAITVYYLYFVLCGLFSIGMGPIAWFYSQKYFQ